MNYTRRLQAAIFISLCIAMTATQDSFAAVADTSNNDAHRTSIEILDSAYTDNVPMIADPQPADTSIVTTGFPWSAMSIALLASAIAAAGVTALQRYRSSRRD